MSHVFTRQEGIISLKWGLRETNQVLWTARFANPDANKAVSDSALLLALRTPCANTPPPLHRHAQYLATIAETVPRLFELVSIEKCTAMCTPEAAEALSEEIAQWNCEVFTYTGGVTRG